MPRYCEHCGVDAPDAGQCGDVDGTRHSFIEGIFLSFFSALNLFLHMPHLSCPTLLLL